MPDIRFVSTNGDFSESLPDLPPEVSNVMFEDISKRILNDVAVINSTQKSVSEFVIDNIIDDVAPEDATSVSMDSMGMWFLSTARDMLNEVEPSEELNALVNGDGVVTRNLLVSLISYAFMCMRFGHSHVVQSLNSAKDLCSTSDMVESARVSGNSDVSPMSVLMDFMELRKFAENGE